MRVTNNQMANAITGNLFANTRRLLKAQETVATEKSINRPSDDPVGMGKILDYRKTLSSNDQYSRNIVQGKSRIAIAETTLDMIDELLVDAKNIAMDQSSASVENANRAIAAEQVKQIKEQILQLANTKIQGNYMFAGFQSDQPAFAGDGTYNGDSGAINTIAGESTQIRVNSTGDEILISSSGVNVFDVLNNLQTALEIDPYVQSDISDQIQLLEDAHDQVNFVRAESASRYSRLETIEERLRIFKLNTENMLSGVEDADLVQAVVELRRQETAYEASLAAAAKVIDFSLLDFIR